MIKLTGRRAVVTGAGSGIGRAIAIELARAGCEVAVLDLSEPAAAETCDIIGECGGSAFPIGASVADSEQVAGAFGEIDRRWKSIDILINNAGINAIRPTLELTDEEWHRTRSVNFDGVFFCSREAGRRMMAGGGGTIVNVGSIYSLVAAPQRLAYCATKAAVAMMTKTLAIEWAQFGIRVNAVAPGYTLTPAIRALGAEQRIDLGAIEKRTPQGRMAEPAEIGEAVVYLCGAGHVTGQVLAVDGGWTAYGYL